MLNTTLELAAKYDYLSDKFRSAYEWLKNNDTASMEDGRYDICEGVYAMVQRYATISFEEARFETHKEYFDIQYLARGHEAFGIAMRDDLELVEQKPENDCYFYRHPKFYTTVNLKAGELVVVPPEEAHQPRVACNGVSEEVVKVVIKVRV